MLGVLASFAIATPALAGTVTLPAPIVRQISPAYRVLTVMTATPAANYGPVYIVALANRSEALIARSHRPAPARPLLLFARQASGDYRQVGRNDTVILRADEGGQCDPFEDGGDVITVKGAYFTVENGVACGQHWTDYITFRFDPGLSRYVFDNERRQSWSLNNSNDPDAEALVADSPPHVRRGWRARPVLFDDWRPAP